MLSHIPFDLSKIDGENLERQILRIGLIAELDAINLYEQLATLSEDKSVKQTFRDIVKEEKKHLGEFETLLLRNDPEQIKELEKGTQEVEERDKSHVPEA